jgi:hypothetical protein
MVHLGTPIFWTDIAIASQHAYTTHSAMTCNEKLRTHQPVAELNIDVLPAVFSHHGAFAAQCKKFEEKVRELSSRAWRELNNIAGVRLAKALGLFIKHCAAKGFKINQQNKEKTREKESPTHHSPGLPPAGPSAVGNEKWTRTSIAS